MITIQKAERSDAEKLTDIMKRTFDEEARRWLSDDSIVDYNIQPPGYSSVEMTNYMIEELVYFKIIAHDVVVGGIILTLTGSSFGRIDRIFVDPDVQGQNIGSTVIRLIEETFPDVRTWDLETSSRQVNNHHFYEKMGYRAVFQTEDEYSYIKRIKRQSPAGNVVEQQDLSLTQYEDCKMEHTEYYQVTLEGSSFCNSNLMNTHFSNCNLRDSTFKNINFTHASYADLNLSYSSLRLVTMGGVRFMDTSLGEKQDPLSFERCELQGTTIKNSNLKNVQITGSDISGMTIDGISVEELLDVYKRHSLL